MKTLLITLVLLATGPVWAEWVRVDQNDEAVFYIDPATIRKEGNFRKLWELQDLKQRHKNGELSRRARVEYDCNQERKRIIFMSTHRDFMLGGVTLFSHEFADTNWGSVPPNTADENILKIVCAK